MKPQFHVTVRVLSRDPAAMGPTLPHPGIYRGTHYKCMINVILVVQLCDSQSVKSPCRVLGREAELVYWRRVGQELT